MNLVAVPAVHTEPSSNQRRHMLAAPLHSFQGRSAHPVQLDRRHCSIVSL